MGAISDFTYAGVRGACRYCCKYLFLPLCQGLPRSPRSSTLDGLCHPQPQSDGSDGRMQLDQDEKTNHRQATTDSHRSYSSQHKSSDFSSSITQIQEPQRVYSLESTIKTQPRPMEEMSYTPSSSPQMRAVRQSANIPPAHTLFMDEHRLQPPLDSEVPSTRRNTDEHGVPAASRHARNTSGQEVPPPKP